MACFNRILVPNGLKVFCKCEQITTKLKLYHFEKIPKEINDIHISVTVSLITLRLILVNINE